LRISVDLADVTAGKWRDMPWAQIEDFVVGLVAENANLATENERLRRQLRAYENPHTPPSLERRKKAQRPEKGGKRGAPVGHPGATRKTPEAKETVTVRDAVCIKCQAEGIVDEGIVERPITELGQALQPETTNFRVTEHRCVKCGTQWRARHADLPQQGVFGVRVLTYVTMLRHHMRGPLRRVRDYLLHGHHLDLSATGVHDLLTRVEETCKAEYDGLLEKIRAAPWLHIDETGHKIDGEKVWLWVFRTGQDDVLIVIRPERSKAIVDEILGENSHHVVVVDGAKAYNGRRKQRCWAHQLRIVDEDREASTHALALSMRMHAIYESLVAFHEGHHSPQEREAKRAAIETEIWQVALDNIEHPDLDTKLTYLMNGRNEWATCLLFPATNQAPAMPATNNPAEQAIREHVIRRRLFQTFRSDAGAERYQYAASLLDSWRLQGKDPFAELEALLRRDLCLQ
jgi:transposase